MILPSRGQVGMNWAWGTRSQLAKHPSESETRCSQNLLIPMISATETLETSK